MRDTVRGEPCADTRRLRRGLGTQAMIDGQRDHAAAARLGPAMTEQGERQTIGATGNADGQAGRSFEGSGRAQQPGEFVVAEPRGRDLSEGAQVQPSLARSRCAVVFTWAVALG